MTQTFHVSTRRTGLLRTIRVDVYNTQAEMLTVYERAWRKLAVTRFDDAWSVQGSCLPARPMWDDRDPRPYQARILLHHEHLTVAMVVHEATHAAMHIYSIDGYRDHARASAHVRGENEVIPYMVADISTSILNRIETDRFPVGDGHTYGGKA